MEITTAVGEIPSGPGAHPRSLRAGPYAELITNDVGLGRYFEAARVGRLFSVSTALGATLNANASPLVAAGTPLLAIFNPSTNTKAAVILKAICHMISGASSTPIVPVWNYLTNVTAMTAAGTQSAIPAILSGSGTGTMRHFVGAALTAGAAASVLLRPWAGNWNEPRHAGTTSETSAGVLVEETEGSIIVPPGTILSVMFNAAGAAVTGCISIVYAEVDWSIVNAA